VLRPAPEHRSPRPPLVAERASSSVGSAPRRSGRPSGVPPPILSS